MARPRRENKRVGIRYFATAAYRVVDHCRNRLKSALIVSSVVKVYLQQNISPTERTRCFGDQRGSKWDIHLFGEGSEVVRLAGRAGKIQAPPVLQPVQSRAFRTRTPYATLDLETLEADVAQTAVLRHAHPSLVKYINPSGRTYKTKRSKRKPQKQIN